MIHLNYPVDDPRAQSDVAGRGRCSSPRTFANIRKFLRFLLSSNIGEVLTMFLGVMLAGVIGLDATGDAVAVPLLATQILWINLLTDSAPVLALGVDPPPDDVMARPPRRLTDRIIDARMWAGIVWVGLVIATVILVAHDLRLEGGILGDPVESRCQREQPYGALRFRLRMRWLRRWVGVRCRCCSGGGSSLCCMLMAPVM